MTGMGIQAAQASSPKHLERYRQAAFTVAEELRRRALPCRDGSVTWREPLEGRVLGPQVYDGTAGIALFLAACHRHSGQAEHRDLALRAISPLRAKLKGLVRDPGRAAALRLGVGGLVGLGAFVYAFARIGHWLEDSELLAEAGDLVAQFTPERFASDERLDVMSGSAGAVLALLTLEELCREAGLDPPPSCLRAALAAGSHLLASRVRLNEGPLAWPGVEKRPPLSGFAHGAAGISYALLRLYLRTGEECLRQAALEGHGFERSLYDPRARNWLDPRFGRLLEQSAWCHGAPGIALGRLGALKAADDLETRRDLRQALEITCALPHAALDHLCCGNMGLVEILLTASRILDRSDLYDDARRRAEQVLALAAARDGFALHRPEPEEVDAEREARPAPPSLFLGLGGLGYTFLRLADPGGLPCLLLLH